MSQTWLWSDVVRKPFDIETLWFTELLEAIGQPNGLNCEHHKYLRTNAGIRKSLWSRRSGSDLFVSQTKSSMPGCVLKRSLVVVLLIFLSVQFSAVHCAVHMQPTHDLDSDWSPLSTLAQEKASIITLWLQTMSMFPKALAREWSRPTRPNSNPLVKSLDAWMAAKVLSVASNCFDS